MLFTCCNAGHEIHSFPICFLLDVILLNAEQTRLIFEVIDIQFKIGIISNIEFEIISNVFLCFSIFSISRFCFSTIS